MLLLDDMMLKEKSERTYSIPLCCCLKKNLVVVVAPVAQRYLLGREFDPSKRDFFSLKKLKKKKKKCPTGGERLKSLVHKIRLHGRRGKGLAESFSREKL